ncbi:MAG: hypothetical protein EBZ65_12620 [Betaproteobacteria bacterium]|nr:hypothetical protein [Betaproteobacteria bacterium]
MFGQCLSLDEFDRRFMSQDAGDKRPGDNGLGTCQEPCFSQQGNTIKYTDHMSTMSMHSS